MYVKITNGLVETYPYDVLQLRRDNPDTSFPRPTTDEMMAEWGVFPVSVEPQPDYTARTQNCIPNTAPTHIEGAWTLGWTVADKEVDEIVEYDEEAATHTRVTRDSLLDDSDWTQVADAPVDATAWATYRQALRDVTAQVGFPHNVVWPTKP